MIHKLVEEICTLLDNKKAEDITIINVAKQTSIADYFIIACGKSTTQVKTLAEYVEDTLSKQRGLEPLRKEGYAEGRWAVIDYGDIIVHVFHDATRLFYCLDELWTEGSNVTKFKGKKN